MLQLEISVAANANDDVPTAHSIQVFMLTASVNSEYVPARHDTHVVAPAIFVYLPAGHMLQVELFAAATVYDAFPAGHMLHVLDWENSEYVPARHDTHLFSPDTAEYLPAGHMSQVEISVAANANDDVPTTHLIQVPKLTAPNVSE